MAHTRDRIIALSIAILFFVTSVGVGVAVLWEILGNKDNQETSGMDQQTTKLAGTQMADFTPVEQVDSLQKIDLEVGTGEEAQPGATVTVDYTGAVAATGIIFESSLDRGEPAQIPLSGVIKGWADGIPGMKVGGKRRLVIPADQAYGANPREGSGIPPNAPLVFDVTLHAVGE